MYHIKMCQAISVKQYHADMYLLAISITCKDMYVRACICVDINREEARQSASQAWSSVFRTSTEVAVIFHHL